MTKSTITDKRVTSVIERLEHYACNLKWTNVRGAQDLLTAADGLRELQERRKVERDTEPYGFTDGDRRGMIYKPEHSDRLSEPVPVYRHAQPAPVVPEEWTIADAVKFCKETGRQDAGAAMDAWNACRAAMLQENPVCTCPSGDGSLRWPCPVHPGSSPAIPDGYVMVPKEPTPEMLAVINEAIKSMRGSAATYARVLAAAPQSPGSEPATVPGKWIPVSERMPEMGEKQRYVLAGDFKNNYWPNIPNTQVGVYGDWFDDGNPTWDDGDGEDLHLKEVTHWMPLPAGPQEVR